MKRKPFENKTILLQIQVNLLQIIIIIMFIINKLAYYMRHAGLFS